MKTKTEKIYYNQKARKGIEELIKENGIILKFISQKTGIEYTTFSKWKNEKFNFKEDKLNKIESFLDNYKQRRG